MAHILVTTDAAIFNHATGMVLCLMCSSSSSSSSSSDSSSSSSSCVSSSSIVVAVAVAVVVVYCIKEELLAGILGFAAALPPRMVEKKNPCRVVAFL